MEAVADIIKDAMQEIGLQDAEQTLQPSETSTCIRYLNRMMSEFEGRGYDLNYEPVSVVSDEITSPNWCLNWMVLTLAIKIAPQFDIPVSADLRANQMESNAALMARLVRVKEPSLPLDLYKGAACED